MIQALPARLGEVRDEGSKTLPHELEAILEGQLFVNGVREVFLHAMSNHPYIHPFDVLDGHCDVVAVIPGEVMEEDGALTYAEEADLAAFVRSAPILPSDKVVISDLSSVCRRATTNVAMTLMVEPRSR